MNSSGLVIENNRTLPYGEGWLTEATPSTNDKKFETYQRDTESGLDYAMARYDQPTTGRFLSHDPSAESIVLHEPRTWNRYVYVKDDPINLSDPTGLCSINGTNYPDGGAQCPNGTSVSVTTPAPPPSGIIEWAERLFFGIPSSTPINTLKEWDDLHQKENCGRLSGLAPDCMSDADKAVLNALLNDPMQLKLGMMPFMPSLSGAGGLLNTLKHIFGDPEHNLEGLVKELAGQLNAYEAIANATVEAIEKMGLTDGRFNRVAVKIGSQIVYVSGKVIDGIVNIGTAGAP